MSSTILLLFFLTITATQAQNTTDPLLICSPDSNFTSNSSFQSNLDLLLPKLISDAAAKRSAALSESSRGPQQVYGAALCRGDVPTNNCTRCLSQALQLLKHNCSHNENAQAWDDECMIRYSNASITYVDDEPERMVECSDGNVTDVLRFDASLRQLTDELTKSTAYGSDGMFGAGRANYSGSGSSWVYGLMQCTQDLTQDQCANCLSISSGFVPGFCWGKRGGVVAGTSCYFRFESFAFYNESAVPSLVDNSSNSTTTTGDTDDRRSFSGGRRGLDKSERIPLIIIPIISVLVFVMAIILCLWRRRRYIVSISSIQDEEKQPETRLFSLTTLREATDNFVDENKLGEGGFGAVYKGVLADGLEIAVKRLSKKSKQGLIQLRNEVVFVAKLQHRNLVRLLGFCLEEREKLLVYEFLPNGSLDKFLFDPTRSGELDWPLRRKIIEGIAKGLLYLHEDSQVTIVHRDLKASNILLDQDMNAKISDFGLARLFDIEKSCESTSQIAGTNGYMAPEYALHGHFATRTDVYSYGVLVLEIVTGRKITDFHGSGKEPNLLSYAWNSWNEERAKDIVDPKLGEMNHYEQEVLRCIHIGLLCVQDDPSKRPNMAAVVLMLNSYSVTLPTPLTPGFYVNGGASDGEFIAENSRFEKLDHSNNSAEGSINYVSVTTSQPR